MAGLLLLKKSASKGSKPAYFVFILLMNCTGLLDEVEKALVRLP